MSLNAVPSVQHVDPNNISGLVAWYKFDEASGTNVSNFVNAANNGTILGTGFAWNSTGGKYNGALTLNTNNTSSGIATITDPVLGATAFTYSCWMNANYTQYGSPYSDCNGTIKNIVIYENDANTMRFYVGNGTTLSGSVSNANWSTNQWHMITATFNGTTGRMDLWVDNKKSSTTTTITQLGNTSAGSTASSFGRYMVQYNSTTGIGALNGSIDSALFYNRSLTDVEIQSLYYSQLTNVTVKTNANSNSGTIPDNGGSANIPYSSGSITTLIPTVPNSVVVDGTTIADYTSTVPPVSYSMNVISSQEYTPLTSFTNTPSYGTRSVTVTFTDTSTNLPTAWNWNFGDGGSSHSRNPTHQYTTAGTYTITLTASNGQGSSTYSRLINIRPAAGDNGVINNGKRVAIYIESTETNSTQHDSGFGSMLHEYNITYLTNATVANSLSIANYDLLVVGSGSNSVGSIYGACSNSTAKYVNDYIASGGSVWFISDPRNETNTYITNMSNATWGLPANKFFCFGSLSQVNVTAGSTVTINNADTATSFMPISAASLSTVNRWTDVRNFGGVSGQNAYGYNYTELLYHNGDATKCQLAKVWNDTTGSRIVYSTLQDFVSGGDCSYFNTSTSALLFNNLKTWMLKLDSNTKQVSVTYPRGDRQFVCCFDDINMSADPALMNDFFSMIDAQPNDIGITSFVIPTGKSGYTTPGSMVDGYSYLKEKGVDVDTIHPHQPNLTSPEPEIDWWHNYVSLFVMQNSLKYYCDNYSVGVNNDPSLEFTSIRFPQTKTNTTSTQAAVNLGFKIASSYGPSTTMTSIAESHLNMRYAQKQKIVSGVKTSQIEMEAPATFDTSFAETGTVEQWIADNEVKMLPFFNSSYQGISQINGHWQWSMTNATWTNAVRDMLWYADNQTAYTAYTNLSTLALYEIAIQEAGIRVDTSDSTTTATINAKYPIKDFTLKLQNINSGITVSLDGRQLTADHVVYEDNVYYVFADIPTGTHTLTVTDAAVSGAKYIGKNGVVSVNISNGAFVKNNAATTKVAVTSVLSPYTNCTNNMTASGNTVSLGAHNMSQQLMATFIPSGGNVTVEVNSWNNTYKKWTENSATHNATMDHWIGGFMPDQYTVLKIDGVVVGEYTASDEGYIAFRYDAGYSEHTFETVTNNPADFDVTIAPKDTINTLKTVSVNATGMSYENEYNLLGSVVAIVTNGYSLGAILLIVLGMYCVVRYLRGEM